MTKDWSGVQENTRSFLLSSELIIIALFSCLYLNDKLGLCSLNCQTHKMTRNCSGSIRVLANSLRMVSAMTENLPQEDPFLRLYLQSSTFKIPSLEQAMHRVIFRPTLLHTNLFQVLNYHCRQSDLEIYVISTK